MKLNIPTADAIAGTFNKFKPPVPVLWIAKIQFVRPEVTQARNAKGKIVNANVMSKRCKAKTVKVEAVTEQEAINKLAVKYPRVRTNTGGLWHLISIRKYNEESK